jgi:hypothetical protein
MNREVLEYYANCFNRQEGNSVPCSNQVVVCAVVTQRLDRALKIMSDRGVKPVRQSRSWVEWIIGNERWIWRPWNENCRGYRFYKVIVEESVEQFVFEYIVKPCCDLYCCSFEII